MREIPHNPMCWRITRLSSEVQYYDHELIVHILGEFDSSDMIKMINDVGYLFQAIDVIPLYDYWTVKNKSRSTAAVD